MQQDNTIQAKKCNAMQRDEKKNNTEPRPILVFYEGVMNERFVAVSTVAGFRIRGCSSTLRCDFSVMRGWQQIMDVIRWIEQFAEKITAEFVTLV